MPNITFNFLQINFLCCSRRNSNRDRTAAGTASDLDTASDTFSDFEVVQPAPPQQHSRARLRWIRAILAAIVRQRIVRAFVQLQKITKRNKAIGVADPVASRLWGQTGHWLQRHKL